MGAYILGALALWVLSSSSNNATQTFIGNRGCPYGAEKSSRTIWARATQTEPTS